MSCVFKFPGFYSIATITILFLFRMFPAFGFINQDTIPKGEIIDTVRCTHFVEQTYSLYIPTIYKDGISIPVIYIFEPGARGILPVSLYKAVAEKYGYILAASNNSRNGSLTNGELAYNAIQTDLKEKWKINISREYTCGFSGGGRFAQFVGFTKKGVSGVIAVAGPMADLKILPSGRTKVVYVGLVGTKDMNFNEHRKYAQHLDHQSVSNVLFTYNAEHQWAPVKAFERALLWLEMKYMLSSTDSKKLITTYIEGEILWADSIVALDPASSVNRLKSLNKNFIPLTKEMNIEEKIDQMEKAHKKRLKADLRRLHNEAKWQQDCVSGLYEMKDYIINPSLNQDSTKYNLTYWKNIISGLNRKIQKHGTDHYAARQLNFLVGQVYGLKSQFYTYKNHELDLTINSIELMLHPENPILLWTQVLILYKIGEKSQARSYLKSLAKLDPVEVEHVKQMEQFSEYRRIFPELF